MIIFAPAVLVMKFYVSFIGKLETRLATCATPCPEDYSTDCFVLTANQKFDDSSCFYSVCRPGLLDDLGSWCLRDELQKPMVLWLAVRSRAIL